jgi:HlyD family secretion protein
MTANVSVIVDRRDRVLRVPMAAIRFSPSLPGTMDGSTPGTARVWKPGAGGRLAPVALTLGLNDGNFAEVADGELRPGDQVLTGLASATASSNPPALVLRR